MGQPEPTKALKRHEKVTELERKLRELEREHKDTEQIMSDMGVRRKKVEIEIKQLRNQLTSLQPKEIGVSDHALLRYLERHCGINVEAARFDMLEKVKCLKDFGTVTAAGFVIKNGTVVTYLPEKQDG
jgi:septal ring factor EnvC (AmiA/AmiB activator)